MKIEVKGRNVAVPEDMKEHVVRRFRVIDRQVSDLASLEVELFQEHNPSIADACVAEATLYLKGVTLRASSRSRDLKHAINMVSDELMVQVKRHRDKRRKRREARAAAEMAEGEAEPSEASSIEAEQVS